MLEDLWIVQLEIEERVREIVVLYTLQPYIHAHTTCSETLRNAKFVKNTRINRFFLTLSLSLFYSYSIVFLILYTYYIEKTYCCKREIECFITVLHYRKGYAVVVIPVVNIRKIIQTVLN